MLALNEIVILLRQQGNGTDEHSVAFRQNGEFIVR